MRSGTWSGRKSTDNTRVTINGVLLPVGRGCPISRVTVTAGMRDGHPAAVAGGQWCVTATIYWANPADVTATVPEPFSGTSWLPEVGDTVVIETGEASTNQWWVRHRGVIDETTGSFKDGTAVSQTVDMIDELNGRVTVAALLGSMTPTEDNGPRREVGLQSTWLVDRALRRVQGDGTGFGWYATPQRTWDTVALAPNMGSLWPDVGVLDAASKIGGTGGPAWYATDYGVAPTTYQADYRTSMSIDEGIITLHVGGGGPTSGRAWVMLRDANGDGFIVGRDHSDDTVFFGIRTGGVDYVDSLPRNGADRIALRFKAGTSNNQIVDYAVNDGRTGHRDYTSTILNAFSDARVKVYVPDGARLGWWMVESAKPTPQWWTTLNTVTSARLRVGDMQWWDASRDIQFTSSRDVLEEQLTAECAAMWLDEDGVMQWAGRGVLEAQPVARTVTSQSDLADVQWQSRRRSMARGVWVDYSDPQIELGNLISRTFWETGNFDLRAGEEEVAVISVPGDEDWIDVDMTPSQITTDTGGWASYATGTSYGGMEYVRATGESDIWALFINFGLVRENLRTYKVSFSPWTSMVSGHNIKSVYPVDVTGHAKNYRETGVKLRGRARVKWMDRQISGVAGSVGPSRFSHDVGWRVQENSGSLNNLLAFLVDVVSSTNPVVDRVEVMHDPRGQVGDVIRVQDVDVTGVQVDVIAQQVTYDSDTFTDSITGRIIAHQAIPGLSLHQPPTPGVLTPPVDSPRKDSL